MQSMSDAHGKERDSVAGTAAKKHESQSSQKGAKQLQKSHSDSEADADEEDNSYDLVNDGADTNGSMMRQNEPSKPFLQILKFD